MKLLDGLFVSQIVKNQIKEEVTSWRLTGGKKSHLATILIGNNKASQTYVNNKKKQCHDVCFDFTLYKYDDDISEVDVINVIKQINDNKDINGLFVQLPLPSHINVSNVINYIDPTKDVDGLHPHSMSKLIYNQPTFMPATLYGILMLLDYYQISTVGKHCVIVGRSDIVGKPLSVLLSNTTYNATVTLCHSKTDNVKQFTIMADILIVAIGKPKHVTADMVKPGAIIIDVGINHIDG